MPAYGSCAGMILPASEVLDTRPDAQHLSGIDMTVSGPGSSQFGSGPGSSGRAGSVAVRVSETVCNGVGPDPSGTVRAM